MIRETLNANSRYAYALVSAGNGVSFQHRLLAGAWAVQPVTHDGVSRAPYWVRLRRTGNVFTAFVSANGAGWRQQGNSVTIAMGATVYAGLAVTSHLDGSLATAAFSNMSLSAGGTTPPPTNRPPTITGTPPSTAPVDVAYSFTPTATDLDGDPLTYGIANRPTWATFNTTTGPPIGDADERQRGKLRKHRDQCQRRFGHGELAGVRDHGEQAAPANRAPVISGTPPTSVTQGTAYSFQPTASDPDGNTLTFSITNRPSWATFSTTTGRLQGTPTASNVGTQQHRDQRQRRYGDGAVAGVRDRGEQHGSGEPCTGDLGHARTSVTQGTAYSFQPTASDPDGNTLTFSITNAPSWATFNATTGRLQGTPTASHVGTSNNIVIRVSDGSTTTSLAAFNITVLAVASGSATLSWTPPTTNTDGSPLTNLAGYRVYWGPAAGSYTNSVTLNNPGLTSYVVGNLAPGTYYFVVSARNSSGVESAMSNSGSKTIQ